MAVMALMAVMAAERDRGLVRRAGPGRPRQAPCAPCGLVTETAQTTIAVAS